MKEIVPYVCQEQPDYVYNLLPGYRFCPTDSELILYYLKPKIEIGEHPKCRIYEVNLYNHSPEELTSQHRPCDDKWYFFTPRERKYEKGKVPNRRTGDFGFWKTTQKYTSVYHHYVTGPRVVGTRRSLEYRDEMGCKTAWLMQEYVTNDPNLPIGSGQDTNKVLTDWVLCKIYKKKNTNETAENTIAQAPHQVFSSEDSTDDQYQQMYHSMSNTAQMIPHGATASISNYPHVYAAQSCANYMSPFSDDTFQQIHQYSMSTATNSSTSAESLASAQPFAYTTPVTLEDVIKNDWGYIFQQDHGFTTTQSVVDNDILEFDDWMSFDDFMSSEFDS